MEKDLISVLIPTYNYDKYIQECILSIINQTYKNIELIIINDGSTDNTWAKLNSLKNICKKRFSNIIFKTQKNIRINRTINKLLHLANGNYYYFIDSDDIAKPNAIKQLYSFLSKHQNYILAVGNNEYIDEQSNIIYLDKNRNQIYDINKALYKDRNENLIGIRKDINRKSFGNYSTIIRENYIQNGFLIRADGIKQINYLNNNAPIWDYYLMLQLSKYYKFKYIDKILYSYRCHKNNDTLIKKTLLLNDMLKTLNYELKLINNINLKNLTDNAANCIKDNIAHFILTSKINYREQLLLKHNNNKRN